MKRTGLLFFSVLLCLALRAQRGYYDTDTLPRIKGPVGNADSLISRVLDEKPYWRSTYESKGIKALDSAALHAFALYRQDSLVWFSRGNYGVGHKQENVMQRDFGVTIIPYIKKKKKNKKQPDTTDVYNSYSQDYRMYFNACMEVLLREKYGWNFFQKLFIRTQKDDGSGRGTRAAMFPGGRSAQYRFIMCNISTLGIDSNYHNFPEVRVSATVDTTGSLVFAEAKLVNRGDGRKGSTKYEEADAHYCPEALRVVKLMPRWVPATVDGHLVEDDVEFYIYFDPLVKQKISCDTP